MIKNFFLVGLLASAISCLGSKRTSEIPLSVIEFHTTNSPCIDAIIVNMRAEGCEDIYHSQDQMGHVYACASNDKISVGNYSSEIFLVINPDISGNPREIPGLPFCADASVLVFIINPY